MRMNYSVPPRQGKTAMQEAMIAFTKSLGKAYDEAYLQVFKEFKKECGNEFSDEEINEFIHNHFYFDLEVEDNSFTETPTITIVPRWRTAEEILEDMES